MKHTSTSGGKHKFKTLLLLLLAGRVLQADSRCVKCHAKEVEGYAKFSMSRSLAPASSTNAPPDGSFIHAASQTKFTISTGSAGMMQELSRADQSVKFPAAFVIGSGNHALGYLVQVGDHVFQSPVSYYTSHKIWDVAPGYESDPQPDFSRPVTLECLFCHSGKPLPVADSLNRFAPGVFSQYAISCERCHGDVTEHLKMPVPGSIINPAKLTGAARASICEQCHLTGETRIPNPGKSIADFKPGQALEDFYTTYVAAHSSGKDIKVISHSEQLALSKCSLKSEGRLWCGTCHNPHDKPAQPAAYFRERCLGCHAATLEKAHAAPGRDCIGCHMQKLPARDGGHTAFTDHRILKTPGASSQTIEPDTLTAWREPDSYIANRNLALALVAAGLQNRSAPLVIRGYKMMNRLEKDFPNDPALLTSLGLILMKGKEPAEALKRFQHVVALKPNYAPYYVNEATALLATNQKDEARRQLQKALSLDPLLESAVQLLIQIDRQDNNNDEAARLLNNFDAAMGITRH